MAAALWLKYKEWADETEPLLLDWSDPAGNWRKSPMQDYPLADFATVFAISIGYLLFVVFGTLIMKSDKVRAFDTSAFQFIYNPVQIVACAYMTVETAIQAYRHGYKLVCNDVDSANPVMGNLMYFFFLSKLLDMCDTVFIILGKKWKQLSVLHVYHHMSVFFIFNHLFRTSYDGDLYMTILLNGGIHTVMYLYYFVSSHTRNIWWKKYLTMLQMMQFLAMNLQGFVMVSRGCDKLPAKIPALYLGYVQSLFWLFMNFFVRNYIMRSRSAAKTASAKKQQ